MYWGYKPFTKWDALPSRHEHDHLRTMMVSTEYQRNPGTILGTIMDQRQIIVVT